MTETSAPTPGATGGGSLVASLRIAWPPGAFTVRLTCVKATLGACPHHPQSFPFVWTLDLPDRCCTGGLRDFPARLNGRTRYRRHRLKPSTPACEVRCSTLSSTPFAGTVPTALDLSETRDLGPAADSLHQCGILLARWAQNSILLSVRVSSCSHSIDQLVTLVTTTMPSHTELLASLLAPLDAKLRAERLEEERATEGRIFTATAKPSTDPKLLREGLNALDQLGDVGATVLKGLELPLSRRVIHTVGGDSGRSHIAAVSFKCEPSFASQLRAATRSIVQISPARWLYPQIVEPMGLNLKAHRIVVAPEEKYRLCRVKVLDVGGPVAGVEVAALLDTASGINVAEVTDDKGYAHLRIPRKYPDVYMFFVSTTHTHWSKWAMGFKAKDFPTSDVEVSIDRVWPDNTSVLDNYRSYSAAAGAGVKVGVIDSGVGPHQNILVAGGMNCVSGEIATNFVDNGIGHGTHVAGIIAGNAQPGVGMVGLAPRCTLMSYRVCSQGGINFGKANSADVVAALSQAIADECDLVNISWGSPDPMPELEPLLAEAREKGVLVIAATGNDGLRGARFPACYDDAVGVTALGRTNSFPAQATVSLMPSRVSKDDHFIPEFANYGAFVDFVGPGFAIVSTFPGNRFAVMSGTSMAAPFLTGMTARLLSDHQEVSTMPRDGARRLAILSLAIEAAKLIGFTPGREFEGNGLVT